MKFLKLNKTINGLILGSLLLSTGLAVADDTTNKVTVFDRVRDASFAAVSGMLAKAGDFVVNTPELLEVTDDLGYKHGSPEIFLTAVGAISLLTPISALCAAKAISNQTWKNILLHKKTALTKYYLSAVLSTALGYSSFLMGSWVPTKMKIHYPKFYRHYDETIAILAAIGLGATAFVPGSYAAENLLEVMKAEA